MIKSGQSEQKIIKLDSRMTQPSTKTKSSLFFAIFFIFLQPIFCQPPNDNCATGAIALDLGVRYFGNNIGATPDGGWIQICPITVVNFDTVWFTLNVEQSTRIRIDTCLSAVDTILFMYTGTCTTLTCYSNGYNDNGDCSPQSSFETDVVPFSQYYILVMTVNGIKGDISILARTITLAPPTLVDDCASAALVFGGVPLSGTTIGASNDFPSSVATQCPNVASGIYNQWYYFDSGSSTYAIIDTCQGAVLDTVIGLYTGNCGSLFCVVGNDDSSTCGPRSSISTTIVPATRYRVLVATKKGSGGAFTLSVVFPPPPANDACAAATLVTGGVAQTGSTIGATSDGSVSAATTCSPTSIGTYDVWYYFDSGANTYVTVSTCPGGALDTIIHLFSGNCGSLTCIASNNDSPTCGGGRSYLESFILPGQRYRVLVSSPTGIVGSFSLLVDFPSPPANDVCASAILLPLTPVTGTTLAARDDSSAAVSTCSPTSTGSYNVWYLFNTGANTFATIDTCAGSSLDTSLHIFSGSCGSLTCLTANDNAATCSPKSSVSLALLPSTQYYAMVSTPVNIAGSFTLALSYAPTHANNLCTTASQVNFGSTVSGTTVGATNTAPASVCSVTPGIYGTWFFFDSTTFTYATVATCGSSLDTVLHVFSGTCAALTCIGANDDGGSSCSTASTVSLPIVPGNRYPVLVTSKSSSAGPFSLSLSSPAPASNDNCASAVMVADGVPVSGTTIGATDDSSQATSTCSQSAGIYNTWYTFNTGTARFATIDTCQGASLNTILHLFQGTCGTLSCIAQNNDFALY